MAPSCRPRSSRRWRAGGGRVVAMERYPLDRAQMQGPVQRVAQAARQIDAIFIPDGADSVAAIVQALAASGVNPRRIQLIGTGLWDDPRIFAEPGAAGRLVRGARSVRLPCFLGPLPRALRAGPGAHRDARL